MKHARWLTVSLLSGLGLVTTVPWLLASCATTEAGAPAADDPTRALPEAGLVDVIDAPLDGGCDSSDPDCVTKPVTCEQAAWCPVPTNASNLFVLTAVWGSGPTDVWAGGSGGTMLHWDGAAWVPTVLTAASGLAVKNTFHAVWGSGPNDVWAASATNVIFHTDGFENGTGTWTLVPSATDSDFNAPPIHAVWGSSADDVRFGGRPYVFFDEEGGHSINQFLKKNGPDGIEWVGVEGSPVVNGLWGSSPDDLWLIGDNSEVVSWQLGLTMHGTRAGKGDLVWTEVDSQTSVVLRGIWGSSASDVWTVGDKGTIRHIGAGASQWDVVASPTTETLHAVWGSAPNDAWAVGESGTILHWDGAVWTPSLAAFPVNRKKPHLYAVWGSGPNDVWIVGDEIALHHVGGDE